jgi:hypothetical protein
LTPDARNATPLGVAFPCPAMATGLPKNLWAAVISATPATDFPDRLIPFEGRFVGGFSCRVSAVLWAAGLSSSRFITGAYLIAINMPNLLFIVFNNLQHVQIPECLYSGSIPGRIILKTIETALALAFRTVVRAPSGQHNAPDGRVANPARKPRALVDTVFQLIKAAYPAGIHII